ncbi:MAG TPA: DegT/DnrJ/EryC1/StrS family aminotransferase [Candidatus Hydrogenedentes bacterium]|nr:DegT/DnrJ/EryC1/StrS family aminotransferase [Candidatus Hydrogenedentota bacterium]
MIDKQERRAFLERGRARVRWEGEPLLGSVYGEEEVEAAVAAIRRAMTISEGFGFSGEPIPTFEREFAAYIGAKHGIAVNSAGPGLDMAMRYLRLEPGDEVIVPAVNFVAAPLAVVGAGGTIVWGEVDPSTFQLDPDDVARKITPRTRAIFSVHMNGLGAAMDDLIEVARRHPHERYGPLPVVEDVARACGGVSRGRKLGSQGFCGVFSFHTMKNMATLGEGGMITTNDDDFAAFCRSTRFYGMTTDCWGTSNVMTTVQAAVGRVQLRKLDDFIAARRRLAHRRHEMLADVPEITPPYEPPDRLHTFYLYTCLIAPEWAGEKRDRLIRMMDEEYGVKFIVANAPAYLNRKILQEHSRGWPLAQSEDIGRRLFCVPIHPAMSDEDNEFICAALIECIDRLR